MKLPLAFLGVLFSLCVAANNNNGEVVFSQLKHLPSDTTPPPAASRDLPNTGGNDVSSEASRTEKDNVLTPFLNYNFTGNKRGLSNLTPVIDYGFSISTSLNKKSWKEKDKTPKVDFIFAVNPYLAGQISVQDSLSYLPGLMLPGNAGIRVDMYFKVKLGDCAFSFYPLNFGYKVITNFTDSSRTIFQHNLRSGFAFSISDKFILGFQHSIAWHNSTSESENTYKKFLKRDYTDLRYLLISLQTQLNKSVGNQSYLYAEWRGVIHQDDWKDLPNTRIFTLGFKKDISLGASMPARSYRSNYNAGM